MRHQRAFTLIELMVVVVVLAILALVAVPAFNDFILVQRLKGIGAQLTTDLQYGRSEAVSRNIAMRFLFGQDETKTCYTLYVIPAVAGATNALRCDCLAGVGNACGTSLAVEVRTVVVPRSGRVTVLPTDADPAFGFDHVTGGLLAIPTDNSPTPLASFTIETAIDSARKLRTAIGPAGRVTVCSIAGSLGTTPC
jgi:type IV fimbrial biogenesis protein FimT